MPRFNLEADLESVLALLDRYADLTLSLADACLVTMVEVQSDPVLVAAERDFLVYRRHGRRVVPCLLP